MKKVICIDFDGTISKVHGFTEPNPGAIEFINKYIDEFDLVVFTVDGDNHFRQRDINEWLKKHGVKREMYVTGTKIPAALYIDDRAFRFEGEWPEL